MNGSYGAFAASYFVIFNNNVASSITAQGRDLTKTMDRFNEDYWYNQWHNDFELHYKMGIKNVTQVQKSENVSIYADTDSLFVSFKPAIDHCEWKNLAFSSINNIKEEFIILSKELPQFDNEKCIGVVTNFEDSDKMVEELEKLLNNKQPLIIADGFLIKDRKLNKLIKDGKIKSEFRWNWSCEIDFIHGVDYLRFAGFFKKCLEDYAAGYGVENKEDFELERISETIISLAKKKYIMNIIYEDGISHDRLSYIYPKGVELVRSSTPSFAREKIVTIVKYLFSHPDTFSIKELLKLVKTLRKEFELADIDDISMQSSCSNYEDKVLNDKKLPLSFVPGTHFAVKAAAYHNYLLMENKELQSKYEFVKSGVKIKYYYCKNKKVNEVFAYTRGSYPIEFAPDVDYDAQFSKSILAPINSIIEPLGMPSITERLSVIMDIFAGFDNTNDHYDSYDNYDD